MSMRGVVFIRVSDDVSFVKPLNTGRTRNEHTTDDVRQMFHTFDREGSGVVRMTPDIRETGF